MKRRSPINIWICPVHGEPYLYNTKLVPQKPKPLTEHNTKAIV